MKVRLPLIVLTVALLIPMFSNHGNGTTHAPKKLAIFPFTLNADRNLRFLQEGVMDMLATRLARKNRMDILEKNIVKDKCEATPGEMDKAKALKIGETLGVDYVVFGSVTVFGKKVSIDAKILDIRSSQILSTAYDQGNGMDNLIPTIDRFAGDINRKVMGEGIFQREHASGEAAPEHPDAGALVGMGEDGFTSRKRPSLVRRFNLEITGLDMGDLDGDGRIELILIDKKNVFVYKLKENRLVLFKSIEGTWSSDYVHMNAADLDGNGKDEIYVSNLTETGSASFVLEWDGTEFKKIVHDQPWLIRITDLPGAGTVVLGQMRNAEGNYTGRVHILKRQGAGFVPAAPLDLPRDGNVFNFIRCDLSGKGAWSTVLLGPWEHLQVYGPGGERLWKSDQFFGGSLCSMSYFDPNMNRMTGAAERVFLASPIFARDMDGDGIKEVVVCKNKSNTGRMLSTFRWFGRGRVHFMAWDEVGLVSRWTSPELSGPVVGYQVGDLDDDGSKELAVANVTRDAFGASRSRLAVYDVE